MGWYNVAEAIKSGDPDRLERALAQEEDWPRSLTVARNELARMEREAKGE